MESWETSRRPNKPINRPEVRLRRTSTYSSFLKHVLRQELNRLVLGALIKPLFDKIDDKRAEKGGGGVSAEADRPGGAMF